MSGQHAPIQCPAGSLLTPHLAPTLHCFTSPELSPTLHSNGYADITQLLSPLIHDATRQITTRSPSYHNTLFPSFPISLVHRPLPPSFGHSPQHTRTRSGSLAQQAPAALSPAAATPSTPLTPFTYPDQTDRDELFLDAVGATIAHKVDNEWLAPTNPNRPRELDVRPEWARKNKTVGADEAEEGAEKRGEDEDEGYDGADQSVEDLAPWFRELRDQVFARREMVEWETFAWPVGCLLALSTSSPDPLNALSLLWELTSPASLFSPRAYPPRSGAEEDGRHDWASPDVLRFVVLVHDWGEGGGREGWEDAQTLHETIRKTYGLHTALVPVFSAAPGATHPQPRAESARALYAHLAPPSAPLADVEEKKEKREEVVGLGYDVPSPAASAPPPASHSLLPPPSSATPAETRPQAPYPGAHLGAPDLPALSKFVRELVVQSVVPWMERKVVVGNEAFAASKRSIGGRLFSAGRKYFGGSSSAASSAPESAAGSSASSRAGSPGVGGAAGYNAVRGYYPHPSPESQHRRLADLAFMLGDYKLAASVYESVAKDCRRDGSVRGWASATRMAGLALLLLHPPTQPLPLPPAAASPDTYLALAASFPSPSPSSSGSGSTANSFDALKATLMYYTAYLSLASTPAGPSALQLAPPALLRLAAGLGEEVAAAVLIEQAALCELRAGGTGKNGARSRSRRRRWAMEMVMAAVRYEKCGVKSLSRRCLSQAASLYALPPPSASSYSAPPSVASTSLSPPHLPPPSQPLSSFLATYQHLHHSLGRQAYTVGDPAAAVRHFLSLLRGEAPGGGEVGESDEAGAGGAGGGAAGAVDWLDDLALAWQQLLGPSPSLSAAREAVETHGFDLGVRVFDPQGARVRVGTAGVAGGEGEGWEGMEDAVKMGWEEGGKRPGRVEWRGGEREEAVVGELFHLVLPVRNPLESAFLSLWNIELDTDADEGVIEVEEGWTGEVELAPGEKSELFIPLRAHRLGTYTLHALSYTFASLLPVREAVSGPGVRFSRPSHPVPGKPSVRSERPLLVRVGGEVPVLEVRLAAEGEGEAEEGEEGLPRRLFAGETRRVKVHLENKGKLPLGELHALCDRPEVALLLPPSSSSSSSGGEDIYAPSSSSFSTAGTISVPNRLRPNLPVRLLPPGKVLAPGEALDVEVLVRGDQVGEVETRWLFAFRAAGAEGEIPPNECFTTRATHRMEVYPSLEIRYAAQPNPRAGSPFLLGVEAYNAGLPASDVKLTSLALVSSRWGLSLARGTSFEEDIAVPLGWQQSSTFVLAVDALERDKAEGERDEAVAFTVRQVEALLSGKEVGKAVPGEIEVRATSVGESSSTDPLSPALLPSLLATTTSQRLSSLRAAIPTLPPTLLSHLFPLLPTSSSALLVVFYSSASLQTSGHLVLPLSPTLGLTPAPRDTPLRAVLDKAERSSGGGLYEESQRERQVLLAALGRMEVAGGGGVAEESPVSVSVEVKEIVEHDFASGPCILPIRFNLRNLSPTTALSYTLTLVGDDSPSAYFRCSSFSPLLTFARRPFSRCATLSGPLTHRGTLPPLGFSTLPSSPSPSTSLWLPRAGVHRAGAWRLVVREEGKEDEAGAPSWVSEGRAREIRVRDVSASRGARRPAVTAEGAALVDVQA
ncbi:hypothetical protein JCM8097_003339 [Rhodosporidiobolus ruineniae]